MTEGMKGTYEDLLPILEKGQQAEKRLKGISGSG